jgi:hypothetical protein
MREDAVKVKAKAGAGNVAYAAWHHRLRLKPGEVAEKWENGSPITRGEFEALLKPHDVFEIVEAEPAKKGKE